MPHWILNCPDCKKDFTHSEVKLEEKPFQALMFPFKPEFPDGGAPLECPNCKNTSTFQRFQLTYAV